MPSVRAQQWAYFLKRLGFRNSKSSIMIFVDSASDDEVWNRFIANNPYALEACKESHIINPDDIYWLFRQISYAEMRSTFPSRSHGRGIIGPKIVPMKINPEPINVESNKQCKKQTAMFVNTSCKVQEDENLLSEDFVGKRIIHTSFGEGTIIETQISNRIVVQFDDYGNKTLSYKVCLEKGYIAFI